MGSCTTTLFFHFLTDQSLPRSPLLSMLKCSIPAGRLSRKAVNSGKLPANLHPVVRAARPVTGGITSRTGPQPDIARRISSIQFLEQLTLHRLTPSGRRSTREVEVSTV